ncbi:uncharacterized protein G2W53_041106 [Senna tora]|uniref:Uncharacterized protein n=1 Tax=Senna tora TaxID=362788 RepID=A0A834VYX5_9FABA|nr:uncharacterized protein G2W53_041106 [Senna tora]
MASNTRLVVTSLEKRRQRN